MPAAHIAASVATAAAVPKNLAIVLVSRPPAVRRSGRHRMIRPSRRGVKRPDTALIPG